MQSCMFGEKQFINSKAGVTTCTSVRSLYTHSELYSNAYIYRNKFSTMCKCMLDSMENVLIAVEFSRLRDSFM